MKSWWWGDRAAVGEAEGTERGCDARCGGAKAGHRTWSSAVELATGTWLDGRQRSGDDVHKRSQRRRVSSGRRRLHAQDIGQQPTSASPACVRLPCELSPSTTSPSSPRRLVCPIDPARVPSRPPPLRSSPSPPLPQPSSRPSTPTPTGS